MTAFSTATRGRLGSGIDIAVLGHLFPGPRLIELSDIVGIEGLLTDIAEIGGHVFIGYYCGATALPENFYPLYKIVSSSPVAICNLEGKALYEWTDVLLEGISAPAGAGEVDPVGTLHPDGYALAYRRNPVEMQLWHYDAGAWEVVAVADGVGSSHYFLREIVVYAGQVYLIAPSEIWAYRGSALVSVDLQNLTGIPLTVQEAWRAQQQGQNVNYVYGTHGALMSRYQGHWYGIDRENSERYIGWWSAPYDELLITPPHIAVAQLPNGIMPQCFVSDGANGYIGAWNTRVAVEKRGVWCYLRGNRFFIREGLDASIVCGHGNADAMWCLGYAPSDDPDYPHDLIHPPAFYYGRAARIYSIGEGEVAIFSARVEWRAEEASPTVSAARLEWSIGDGDSPTLSAARLEWSIGDGDSPTLSAARLEWRAHPSPTLHAARLEWHTPEHDSPTLAAARLEWSIGDGDSPTLSAARLEWSIGDGDSPTLSAAKLEWHTPLDEAVILHSAKLEWIATDLPGEGEGILWITHDDSERAATAIRVTTDWPLEQQAQLRGLVRCDLESVGIEQWSSYQSFRIGSDVEIRKPGHFVRIGVIGPLTESPPNVSIQLRRYDE